MSALRQQSPTTRRDAGAPNTRMTRGQLIEFQRDVERFECEVLYQKRIEHYGKNPLMRWCLTYLPHQMRYQDGPRKGEFCPPAACHQEMTAAIHSVLASTMPAPALAGLLARGLGKTTYGTTATILWAIGELGKRNVILVCSNKEEAADRIRNIVEELESNERLRADYPGLAAARDLKNQTKAYTDYQIILANGARIKAYAFGGKLRGSNWNNARPDLVILDDPEDEDFAYSRIKRERGWRWVQAVILRALSKYGGVVWLGTPISKESLLLRARRSPQDSDSPGLGWTGPFVPIATEVRGGDGANAPVLRYESAWPDMYSPEDIVRMLAQGDRGIARQELMLEPVDLSDCPFDIAWYDENQYDPARLKFINGRWEYGEQAFSEIRIWIDSASSMLESADRTAIIVGGRLPNSDVLILEVRYGQFKPVEQAEILIELNKRYRPFRAGGQKTHIEETLAQFISRDTFIPWELEAVSNAAGAKDRRIRNSTVYYSSGKVKFAKGDSRQLAVREEMKHYPGGHDDALDTMERLLAKLLGEPGNSNEEAEAVGPACESSFYARWY